MKAQHWTLFSGNKGFVFTLDMVIAIFVLLFIATITAFNVSQANEDKLVNVQLTAYMNGALTILDEKGILQTGNSTLISNAFTPMIPAAYDFRLQIVYKQSPTVILGNEIPKGTFIGTGKYYFASQTDLGVAKFFVWRKA
ncbi:hypothetical protein HZB00_03190 [Candidatus Woesearchaeota archaeon]|nr:hypothetical protein [Candidatus Woesearchaeota archaeon]